MSYNYAVGANPLVTSVADTTPATSPITTTLDLLGRVVFYADAWAKTTTSAYDQPGRLISTDDGPGGRRDSDYDAAGRVSAQKLDLGVLATPAYDGPGSWPRWPTPTAVRWPRWPATPPGP